MSAELKTAALKCEGCGLVHGLSGFALGRACLDALKARVAELEGFIGQMNSAQDLAIVRLPEGYDFARAKLPHQDAKRVRCFENAAAGVLLNIQFSVAPPEVVEALGRLQRVLDANGAHGFEAAPWSNGMCRFCGEPEGDRLHRGGKEGAEKGRTS